MSETNTNTNNKKEELGALWRKKSMNGSEYYSGTISFNGEKKEVVVFQNAYKKEGERTPDFRIYLSERREQPAMQTAASTKVQPKSAKKPEVQVETLSEEEIPF